MRIHTLEATGGKANAQVRPPECLGPGLGSGARGRNRTHPTRDAQAAASSPPRVSA